MVVVMTDSKLIIPEAYKPGYPEARAIDADLTDRFVEHLWIGDPLVDPVMHDIGGLTRAETARIVRGIIEQDDAILRDSPQSAQDLVNVLSTTPDWYDQESALLGCKAYVRSSGDILAAFVGGAIVEGFSTLISKSFAITGRLIEDGVRRLKQNIRHLTDIFLPYGVEPGGDGWKATLRLRLVHGRVRWLFSDTPEWERESWGIPISAAHIGIASACFSARLIRHAQQIGAMFSDEECAGIMAVWCYTGYIMGVPDPLQFYNQDQAARLFEVGRTCEPEPDFDAIALANCIINSAPVVVGVSHPVERAKTARFLYGASRELIGDSLADRLRFPARRGLPILPWIRSKARAERVLGKVFPAWRKRRDAADFQRALELAFVSQSQLSYGLPDHVQAEYSSNW